MPAKDTLGWYWEMSTAWGKRFTGNFKVQDSEVLFENYGNSHQDPSVIQAIYTVLPLQQAVGVMKVSFSHNKQPYEGLVDLAAHWDDDLFSKRSKRAKGPKQVQQTVEAQ